MQHMMMSLINIIIVAITVILILTNGHNSLEESKVLLRKNLFGSCLSRD